MLQLQYLGDERRERLQVKVIGYLMGRSLIVTTPQVDGRVLMMREGQPFVVRILAGNRVVGFSTSVLKATAVPYPHMHLSYPEEMEQIVVRKAQRVKVRLFASVKNANPAMGFDKPQPGLLRDLSTAGGLVTASRSLGEVGDEITVSFAFKLGGVEKLVTIQSVLRNVHHEPSGEHEEHYQHGIEFQKMDDQDTLALHGFVYEQIVKSFSE